MVVMVLPVSVEASWGILYVAVELPDVVSVRMLREFIVPTISISDVEKPELASVVVTSVFEVP